MVKGIKKIQREKRIRRVRGKIFGSIKRPRLTVFKSLKHIYASLIDDENNRILFSVSDFNLNDKDKNTSRKEKAFKIGELLAQKALSKKIEKVVFDRRGYPYHGIIKQIAEGARKKGLKF